MYIVIFSLPSRRYDDDDVSLFISRHPGARAQPLADRGDRLITDRIEVRLYSALGTISRERARARASFAISARDVYFFFASMYPYLLVEKKKKVETGTYQNFFFLFFSFSPYACCI